MGALHQRNQVRDAGVDAGLRQQGSDLAAVMGLMVEKMSQRFPGRMLPLHPPSVPLVLA